MSISHYLKAIGRGARGARPLNREQAADLLTQVLDGHVSDLEVGAFCLAMRVKGETAEEMAGFLDAANRTFSWIAPSPKGRPTIVLPSYNGARKLPVLTPLLALLLEQAGLRVIIHGVQRDPGRTTTSEVLEALGHCERTSVDDVEDDEINFLPIEVISPKLHRLLEVRRVIGLRNSAHSVVKLMNPVMGDALVVGSYTHSAFALLMSETFQMLNANALLIRGIEGEPVADARKVQEIEIFFSGERKLAQEAATSIISPGPDWPKDLSRDSIAAYITEVLNGKKPIPMPIALQIQHIQNFVSRLS